MELIVPVNKLTAVVTGKNGNQTREHKPSHVISSLIPLPTTQFCGPLKDDLTGRKLGRLTVIGCSLWRSASRNNNTRWVVKCTCGKYELRTTKSIKSSTTMFACTECTMTIKQVKRKQYGVSKNSM